MASPVELLLGEHTRALDERYRLSIPQELTDQLHAGVGDDNPDCILAKERPGCLSLWNAQLWKSKLDAGVGLIKAKIAAGRLENRIEETQLLGRLLSSRHRTVQFAGRSRLVIPEGFREFLGVEPGGDVMIVGAGVCLELWRPTAWHAYLETHMPEFRRLFDELAN
jgi:MraZ protein